MDSKRTVPYGRTGINACGEDQDLAFGPSSRKQESPTSAVGSVKITFYPTLYGAMLAHHTYRSTLEAIESGRDVETTQMCMLNEAKDYDLIRIVNGPDDVIEIHNNHDGTYECERAGGRLLFAHSLFKLWENGWFDKEDR